MPDACLGSQRQSPGLNECRRWRESIADIIVIGEDADGHIDLADLESQLARYAYRPLLFGSFSAAASDVLRPRLSVRATRLL